MRKLAYTLSFTTPAFLGNAEQSAQWRAPPFKAQLRQWWRVVHAAEKGLRSDVHAMRKDEARLFARPDKNQSELSALLGGLKKGQWSGDAKMEIAGHAKTMMRAAKKWKEKSEKKNPNKDNNYQDTLKVIAWLKGQ